MYQSRINMGFMIIGIVVLASLIGLSILLAFPVMCDSCAPLTFIFATIAFLAFFGTIFMVSGVIFPLKRGGIPILTPKDYVDESFVFCPIKEEGAFWLATAHNFECRTIAVSQLDFAPKDREFIQESLENSIKQEKRLRITAYGCIVGKGYIFALVDPKDQEKPQEESLNKEKDSSKITETSDD